MSQTSFTNSFIRLDKTSSLYGIESEIKTDVKETSTEVYSHRLAQYVQNGIAGHT